MCMLGLYSAYAYETHVPMKRLVKQSIAPVRWLFFFAAGLTLLAFGLAAWQVKAQDNDTPLTHVYVGTWTSGAGNGIYAFRFDGSTGALSSQDSSQDRVTRTANPSYLTRSPDGRYLYSVNQTADSASVSAFKVDRSNGALTFLNKVSAEGASPCYISIDASGKWVLVANYVGANVAVFPVQEDGSLGAATDVVQHAGSSVNPERQTAPHPHYFAVDPDNRFAVVSDLGIDWVRIYPFDAKRGRIDEQNVREVATPPGTGPRHLDFHPNGQFAYLVGELTGTVTAYRYRDGQLSEIQTVTTLPENFEGANKSAAIQVHPSGKFLYVSNRGDFDSIVVYAIDAETGTLTHVESERETIQWPRFFAVDPSGRFLLAANRQANNVTVFRIDPNTGALSFTGHSVEVPEPMAILFLEGKSASG